MVSLSETLQALHRPIKNQMIYQNESDDIYCTKVNPIVMQKKLQGKLVHFTLTGLPKCLVFTAKHFS